LLLIQRADLVVLSDPVQRRNREAAGARRRILDHILDRGLHHGHHRINQGPWREILAGAGFLLLGVLLQQSLIQIPQSLLAGAVPIQLVELAHQFVERGGLLDERAGIGIDLLHQRRSTTAAAAQLQQHQLVVLQLLHTLQGFQRTPAPFLGDALLLARFLGHLQKQQIGELTNVLVIRHPVVLQHIAEVPELGDDVVGVAVAGGACGHHQASTVRSATWVNA
jgi:hypothetical protein